MLYLRYLDLFHIGIALEQNKFRETHLAKYTQGNKLKIFGIFSN